MGIAYEVISTYSGKKIIYCGECNKVFEYSETLKKFLDAYCSNVQDMFEKLGREISENEIKQYHDTLQQYINVRKEKNEQFCEKQLRKSQSSNPYTTLWLNVSNDCNLRCIYGYGDGGCFNKKRDLIKIEKVDEILKFWLKKIDLNKGKLKVVFFGGEPLLNKEAIKRVVHYLKTEITKDIITDFEITTNGTILDDELLEIFATNHFHVTLSIDGGKEIQDIQRPFTNGKGSYLKVTQNIQKMRKLRIPISARVTVTHKNVSQLMQCLCDIWDLGINNIFFAPVSTENSDLKLTKQDMNILLEQIEKLGKYQYENIVNHKNIYLTNLFQYGKILHQNALGICSFYIPEVLKVDINGNIFRCHRLIGNDKFLAGNVAGEVNNLKIEELEAAVNKCSECTLKSLCIPCCEANYYANQNVNIPCKEFCQLQKAIIIENIRLYVQIIETLPETVTQIYTIK